MDENDREDWVQLRSEPKQDRSQKRVATILKAAAEVFAERGYGDATTNEIARRASTSIGSLYRVFPDKLSLFQALSIQYSEALDSIATSIASPALISLPAEKLVPLFLDAFELFLKRNPAFEAVFVFADANPETRETDNRTKSAAADHGAALLRRKNPKLTKREAFVIARTFIQLNNSYLRTRLTVPELTPSEARKQFERVLIGYLKDQLPN